MSLSDTLTELTSKVLAFRTICLTSETKQIHLHKSKQYLGIKEILRIQNSSVECNMSAKWIYLLQSKNK